MNGLHGFDVTKGHSFVIAAVYGLEVLIPHIFHTFFNTLDSHRVHTKLVMRHKKRGKMVLASHF